jgi:aromatic-L-amino-acid decarboxylase
MNTTHQRSDTTRQRPDDGRSEGAADLTPSEFREALLRVADWVTRYREEVGSFPVLSRLEPNDVRERLPAHPPAAGEPIDRILADLDEIIVPGLTHWNHPGFMAYFASSAAGPSVLAELVIAGLGVNAMLWRTSPAATELELVTIDWLRQAVGLPSAFRGVIMDTASAASFTALLAAREVSGESVRERGLAGNADHPALGVYVSDQAHSSLEKAAIAAGLGQRYVRRIPVDERFRMDAEALEEALERDVDAGVRPTFVCATLGTTSTASVDPVADIADAARRFGCWLHVDAAYAGPAAMLQELRPEFEGWELADSIVLNPHKWMGTPLDCSVLLFRDGEPFRRSLALTPTYLESEHPGAPNLMDYGLSLGRRFRALKLWFLFRGLGTDRLSDTLRDHIGWAREFGERLERDGRFELAAPVSFSTVCFRPVADADGDGEPGDGRTPEEADALGHRVLEALNAEGRVFLSHTVLGGRYTLRLSVGSVHTREEDVVAAFEGLCVAYDRVLHGGEDAA